jgi:hypothetical protein
MSGSKKIIRIDFADFYHGFPKTRNFFYDLLSERFHIEISDKPDFLIYSHEGDHHKLHNCVKIYFTVESFEPDFTECDYALTCRYIDDARHLRFPIYPMYGSAESISKKFVNMEQVLARKSRFCSFIVSNPNHRKTKHRLNFFNKLSKYKKVDSGGRVLNNLGFQVPGSSAEKVEFLRSYKFNIAFENKRLEGYTTEKIFEAMQAFCTPIYWGNPLINREFNTSSFLNYFDFQNEEALIEKIIELDKDDAKYLELLNQPYLHQKKSNEYFNRERVLAFFEHIFTSKITPLSQRPVWKPFGRWKLARVNKPPK